LGTPHRQLDEYGIGIGSRTVILDTGTSYMFVPESDAELRAKVDGSGGYTVLCLTSASVALTFSGTTFAIDPRDLLLEPLQDGGNAVNTIIANPIFPVTCGSYVFPIVILGMKVGVGDTFLKMREGTRDTTCRVYKLTQRYLCC
jgi:Eukaryotic aspartyl protease